MTKRRLTPSEHQIQAAIVTGLRRAALPDVVVAAVPNGGSRKGGFIEGARMKREGVTAGVLDLLILGPGGKVRFMEVKTPKGRLSPAQKDFMQIMDRAGIDYAVVRSVDEAMNKAKEWEILR